FTVLALAVVLAFAFAPGFADDKAEKKDAKFDAAKLVGKWEYVSGKKNGEDVAKDHLVGQVTFTKDEVHLPAGPDPKFVMGYKVDSGKSPAQIDMEIKDGPVKEGKAKGIISLNGDELKIAYGVEGMSERPEKFESTDMNKAFLWVLKRAKDKEKDK